MVTFPRELPADIEFAVANLYPNDPYSSSRSGRNINVMKSRANAWIADLTAIDIKRGQAVALEAWFLSLRGGLRSCNFVPPYEQWPVKHCTNQAPAQTPGNLVSVADGNKLAVSGVDSELDLSAGDLIGIENGDLRALGRVVEVSGAGTDRSVEIEPAPPTDTAVAGAVVRFAQPELIMRPVRNSYRKVPAGGLFTISMSFEESKL